MQGEDNGNRGPPTTVVITDPKCDASQLTDRRTYVESQTAPDSFASARQRQERLESTSAERRKQIQQRVSWGIAVLALVVLSNLAVYFAVSSRGGGRRSQDTEGLFLDACDQSESDRAVEICRFINGINQNGAKLRYPSNETLPDEQALAWIIRDEAIYHNERYPDERLQQRFALASLYFHNQVKEQPMLFCPELRDNWTIQEGEHECDWLGNMTACSEEKVVEAILLDGYTGIKLGWTVERGFYYLRCYVGTIPANLALLSDLTELTMTGQDLLNSTIPSSLYSLSSLETIALGSSVVSGTISTGLISMPQLRLLDLARNNIHGTIPPFLGAIWTLEVLRLDHNQLSKDIPASVMALPLLERLDLHENNLTGTIPENIGSNLVDMQLHGNALQGTVPVAMLSASRLTRFLAFNNRLSGSVEHLCNSTNEFDEIVVDCDVTCPCCTNCCDADTANYVCKIEAGICFLGDVYAHNGRSYETTGFFGPAGPFMEQIMACSCRCKA